MRDIRHRVIIAFTITVLIALISVVCIYFTIKYALAIVITEKYTARFVYHIDSIHSNMQFKKFVWCHTSYQGVETFIQL